MSTLKDLKSNISSCNSKISGLENRFRVDSMSETKCQSVGVPEHDFDEKSVLHETILKVLM